MNAFLAFLGVAAVGVIGANALGETRRRRVRSRAMLGAPVAEIDWRARVGAGSVLAVAVLVSLGVTAALVYVTLVVGVPVVTGRVVRSRAEARYDADLAPVLDAIARSLRAGATITSAIDEASSLDGPVSADLRQVVERSRRGAGIVDALDAWASAADRTAVRLVAAALALAAEVGGSQARAVDGLAATVRSRQTALAEARAQAAQARLSAAVIALAPLGFAVLTGAGDVRALRFLVSTPLGITVLVVGLALDGAGAVWMRRLSRRPAAIAEGAW